GRDPPARILLKILIEDPRQVGYAVQHYPVDMLKSVIYTSRLPLVQAHEWLHIDIRVHAFNIGVRMMINVVFDFPVITISAQYVQKIRRHRIDPCMPGKALMSSLMHNIETDQRN